MPRLILPMLALILPSGLAWAEMAKDSWENLKQLQPGHKVKVVDTQLKSWSGKLVSVSDEAITIREKQQHHETTVERADVLRVTDLERSHRPINAVIGGLAGALLTAWAGGESSDDVETAFFVGMMGAIGAGVGAAIPHPRPTIYRSKEKPKQETSGDL